jgi:hypothetical protein
MTQAEEVYVRVRDQIEGLVMQLILDLRRNDLRRKDLRQNDLRQNDLRQSDLRQNDPSPNGRNVVTERPQARPVIAVPPAAAPAPVVKPRPEQRTPRRDDSDRTSESSQRYRFGRVRRKRD